MTDRRRINGPVGGTIPTLFAADFLSTGPDAPSQPPGDRKVTDIRKIYLKPGLTPSASGSAYLELEPAVSSKGGSLIPPTSSLKLTCSVHGPRPLPRSASFSPHMLVSTHVKFSPFATRHRRGYLRDVGERDIAAHLDNALRATIISERWPKSSLDVIITVLEGEESQWWGDDMASWETSSHANSAYGLMSILSGCITVASAAILDAGIDCMGIVSGGAAALVKGLQGEEDDGKNLSDSATETRVVVDPSPSQHKNIVAMCAVGFIKARDEVTELWVNGGVNLEVHTPALLDLLIDNAVQAAAASTLVIEDALASS